MLGDDPLAGVGGIGDGQRSAGHHGIIPAFQRVTRTVEAVIGGDARNVRRPGRGKGGKGRSAGAHMHQIDFLALDQPYQPPAIGQHDGGVFRLHRHGRQDRPARLQIGRPLRPPCEATTARPPAFTTASATSSVVCSAPPVSRSGITRAKAVKLAGRARITTLHSAFHRLVNGPSDRVAAQFGFVGGQERGALGVPGRDRGDLAQVGAIGVGAGDLDNVVHQPGL